MILGVIPARYASTRLPGKPLSEIGGKPMLRHTYENALKSTLIDEVLIATDDVRIQKAAEGFNAPVIMTPDSINTGSDRIAWAAKKRSKADIIVNIQGDEPFISGKVIDKAIEPLLFDKSVDVSTLMKKIINPEELSNPSVVKIVFDYFNFALYFSRSPIPFIRDAENNDDAIRTGMFFKHIGLYVFRTKALYKFTSMQQTDLEKVEKLEQLRLLEKGVKIKVVETDMDSVTVDTQKDLEYAREYYEKNVKGNEDGNQS